MSLPKKDAHVHFTHDWYEVISSLADADNSSVTAWVEQAAMEKADREARRTILVASRLEQSGAMRIFRDGEKE